MDYGERLSDISNSIDALGGDLGDVQFAMLREAVRMNDVNLSTLEKRLARARRSLDKARSLVDSVELGLREGDASEREDPIAKEVGDDA
ncbi:MAG: hypothetical protein ACP5O0_05080 [Acidimicrobiales bacterium]